MSFLIGLILSTFLCNWLMYIFVFDIPPMKSFWAGLISGGLAGLIHWSVFGIA